VVEAGRIADQLTRANEGGAWHGPSLAEILSGVTAAQAAAKPVAGAHSIWELVLHVAAWEGAARERIETGKHLPPADGDWPEISDTSEAAWQRTLARLNERHAALLETIKHLDDARLSQQIGEREGGVSVYATLHGVIQHNLYHAGQIALLKKALNQ
jgi:uncharacterized damage-inducible protein DinB